MSDRASDKKKQKHGVLWYLGWTFGLYVLSGLVVSSLVDAGWLTFAPGTFAFVYCVPLMLLWKALGWPGR